MAWFITAIEGPAKTIEELYLRHTPIPRTFGFYNEFQAAYEACEQNRCNMHESLYEFLVMEYIEQGIHPEVHMEFWWQWDEEKNNWKAIGQERPAKWNHATNWAIG